MKCTFQGGVLISLSASARAIYIWDEVHWNHISWAAGLTTKPEEIDAHVY